MFSFRIFVYKNIINDYCVKVKDIYNCLFDISNYIRNKYDIPVVAITGSNGKTTTKELIVHILKSKYNIEEMYQELAALADAILEGKDLYADPVLSSHADWVAEIKTRKAFTAENVMDILLEETGKVFSEVLEDAGVYKCNEAGRAAFMRFVDAVNA